jgi:aminoglycoside phosphotransferase (APT) family kinase protein
VPVQAGSPLDAITQRGSDVGNTGAVSNCSLRSLHIDTAQFRAGLALDAATWARGRSWALWKALITYAGNLKSDPTAAAAARRVIDIVLVEHANAV